MTEAQLTAAVIECAERLGWKVMHQRPARTADGWRTAVQGTWAKGWPDLFMVKPGSGEPPFAVELKADGKKPTAEQRDWLYWLADAGCYAAVWTPDEWKSGHIERVLRTAGFQRLVSACGGNRL